MYVLLAEILVVRWSFPNNPFCIFVLLDNDEYWYTFYYHLHNSKKFDFSCVDTFCNHSSINIDVPIKKILCKPRFSQTSVKILLVVVWYVFIPFISCVLISSPIYSLLITENVLCATRLLAFCMNDCMLKFDVFQTKVGKIK